MSVLSEVSAACDTILDPDGSILTDPFLGTCNHVLPLIDQLGTGLMIVRSDVSGNIEVNFPHFWLILLVPLTCWPVRNKLLQRLRTQFRMDPSLYRAVTDIALNEKRLGNHRGSKSCAKGLLWLSRAMHFVVQLLRFIANDPQIELSTAVKQAYVAVLQPYHGMISYSAFNVRLVYNLNTD